MAVVLGGPQTPLATVSDLAAVLQTTLASDDPAALFQLRAASGKIRNYLQQTITAVTGDLVELDPVNGLLVVLPEMPIAAVSLVETFDGAAWTVADPKTYTLSKRTGIISGKPGIGITWPSAPESWRVTYDHGYGNVPDALVGICADFAARAYSSPSGMEMERIGGYQAKYSADGFSATEKIALNRYRIARVA